MYSYWITVQVCTCSVYNTLYFEIHALCLEYRVDTNISNFAFLVYTESDISNFAFSDVCMKNYYAKRNVNKISLIYEFNAFSKIYSSLRIPV